MQKRKFASGEQGLFGCVSDLRRVGTCEKAGVIKCGGISRGRGKNTRRGTIPGEEKQKIEKTHSLTVF